MTETERQGVKITIGEPDASARQAVEDYLYGGWEDESEEERAALVAEVEVEYLRLVLECVRHAYPDAEVDSAPSVGVTALRWGEATVEWASSDEATAVLYYEVGERLREATADGSVLEAAWEATPTRRAEVRAAEIQAILADAGYEGPGEPGAEEAYWRHVAGEGDGTLLYSVEDWGDGAESFPLDAAERAAFCRDFDRPANYAVLSWDSQGFYSVEYHGRDPDADRCERCGDWLGHAYHVEGDPEACAPTVAQLAEEASYWAGKDRAPPPFDGLAVESDAGGSASRRWNAHRFACYESALEALTYHEGETEDAGEALDDWEPPIDAYYSQQAKWLNEEEGAWDATGEAADEGLVEASATLSDRIVAGQYVQGRAVGHAAVEALKTLAEDPEEAREAIQASREARARVDREETPAAEESV